MPILDYENEVVGVAQIMNKMIGGHLAVFTQADEHVRMYSENARLCVLRV